MKELHNRFTFWHTNRKAGQIRLFYLITFCATQLQNHDQAQPSITTYCLVELVET